MCCYAIVDRSQVKRDTRVRHARPGTKLDTVAAATWRGRLTQWAHKTKAGLTELPKAKVKEAKKSLKEPYIATTDFLMQCHNVLKAVRNGNGLELHLPEDLERSFDDELHAWGEADAVACDVRRRGAGAMGSSLRRAAPMQIGARNLKGSYPQAVQ